MRMPFVGARIRRQRLDTLGKYNPIPTAPETLHSSKAADENVIPLP